MQMETAVTRSLSGKLIVLHLYFIAVIKPWIIQMKPAQCLSGLLTTQSFTPLCSSVPGLESSSLSRSLYPMFSRAWSISGLSLRSTRKLQPSHTELSFHYPSASLPLISLSVLLPTHSFSFLCLIIILYSAPVIYPSNLSCSELPGREICSLSGLSPSSSPSSRRFCHFSLGLVSLLICLPVTLPLSFLCGLTSLSPADPVHGNTLRPQVAQSMHGQISLRFSLSHLWVRLNQPSAMWKSNPPHFISPCLSPLSHTLPAPSCTQRHPKKQLILLHHQNAIETATDEGALWPLGVKDCSHDTSAAPANALYLSKSRRDAKSRSARKWRRVQRELSCAPPNPCWSVREILMCGVASVLCKPAFALCQVNLSE